MNLLESCRYIAFWSIDAARGGKVRKAYNLLKDIDSGRLNDEEIASYQENAIANLLQHARKTINAYKGQATLNLCDWPVVRKTDLKEGLDNHMSSNFSKEKLFVMSTSGSTGTPFRCYQDVNKKRHVNAEVLYYNGLVNFKIGKRIIYFRSIVGEVAKSPLVQFLQNIRLIDCHNLSDEGITKKLNEIAICSANGGGMVLSYASTLDAFRKYFQKHGIEGAKTCKVYGVVSGSELLQDITRNTLEKAFGCKVVSRYANEENGFLGQDDIDANVFIPNRANYYIEILKLFSDEPASEGEVGRIVVTDLYNYAMPFIRYDTGDVGAWVETTHFGKKVKAIGKFGGRVVDMVFDTKGNQISPHTITNNMWNFQGIEQYQFVQKDKATYLIKLNITSITFKDEEKLIELFKEKLGSDAIIKIEYCNEIPVLASGKRRYIVNEMLLRK